MTAEMGIFLVERTLPSPAPGRASLFQYAGKLITPRGVVTIHETRTISSVGPRYGDEYMSLPAMPGTAHPCPIVNGVAQLTVPPMIALRPCEGESRPSRGSRLLEEVRAMTTAERAELRRLLSEEA